jgi:hypothetical protein
MQKLNNMLMQLRKNCNHPDIITADYDQTATYPPADDLVAQAGKMQLLERLLTRLKPKGHKVLVFSQVCAASNCDHPAATICALPPHPSCGHAALQAPPVHLV